MSNRVGGVAGGGGVLGDIEGHKPRSENRWSGEIN